MIVEDGNHNGDLVIAAPSVPFAGHGDSARDVKAATLVPRDVDLKATLTGFKPVLNLSDFTDHEILSDRLTSR